MKKLLPLFFGVALLLPFCSMHAGAQSNSQGSPPAINFSGTLSALNGVVTFNPLPGYSTCVVDVTTTASNVVTVYGEVTSTHPTALTSTSGSATITADGAYVYQVPFSTLVVKATTFGGAAMSVVGWCSQSVATAVSSGGSSSNATIVAPTDAAGNVKVDVQATANVQAFQGTSPWVVSAVQPSPLYTSPVSCATPTCAVVNYPSVTVSPTVTPSAAPAGQPIVSFPEAQCGTAGLFCPLTSSGSAATGSSRNSLNIDVCVPAATTCAVPTAGPADASANAVILLETEGYGLAFNGTTWDRIRTAASPAPTGVVASGYNTAGTAAPIICTKPFGGTGTTDGNVQIVALSGSTHVYVCAVTISVGGTVAGYLKLLSGTGSACATAVNSGPGVEFPTTLTATVAIGSGVGLVFDGGAGNELCIGGTGTSTLYTYSGMYEQF